MVAADARTAVSFSLSPGNAGDAPEGRELLKHTHLSAKYVIMDRAYEGDETRQLVLDLGCTPVVPPKSMTDFTFRDPPNFNERTHPFSRKGTTLT